MRFLFHSFSCVLVTMLLGAAACEDAGDDDVPRRSVDAGDASRSDADVPNDGDARAPGADGGCGAQPSYWCVSSCGTDFLEQPLCGDGGWSCGAGRVRHDSCPPGSCFTLPFVCCRPDGSQAPRVCDTQSTTYACTEGSALTYITPAPDPCRPDAGLDAASD